MLTILAIIYVVGAVLYGGAMIALLAWTKTMSLEIVTSSQIAAAIAATIFWPATLLIQVGLIVWTLWEFTYWKGR